MGVGAHGHTHTRNPLSAICSWYFLFVTASVITFVIYLDKLIATGAIRTVGSVSVQL